MLSHSARHTILLCALVACMGTIPLSNNLNSIAMIVFVAAALLQQSLTLARARLAKQRFWIIPVVYFLWSASSFFWDSSGGYTVKELERYAVLLFVPASLAMIPQFSFPDLQRACYAFVGVTVVVSVICLVKAYGDYTATGDYRVFFYQYLAAQMKLNAIFLSNFCLASITWLFYYGYVEKRSRTWTHHVITALVSAFLLLMIFLLSSKLVIILTFLLLVISVIALGYLRGYFFRALLIVAGLLAIGAVAVSNLHYVKWRMATTEFKRYSGPQDDNNGIAIRLFMWETALDLIEERPLTGYGLKGARIELLDEYRRKDFKLGVEGYYHSHNQYIESSLMAGAPATLLLVLIILVALARGIKERNFLLILIVCHFAIQSLFEATFEVQHEFVFYIVLIFLFYYHAPQWRETNRVINN